MTRLSKKIGNALEDAADAIGARLGTAQDAKLYQELYDLESLMERRFYNVGAGDFRHRYWTNIDHPSTWYASKQDSESMVAWDMLELAPLPLERQSAEVIYSSHALEHVSDAAAANLFGEAGRVLQSGAFLRVTMPDMGLAYRAFRAGDRHFFRQFAMPKGASTRDAPLHELFLARFATSTTELWADQGPAPRISAEEFEALFAEVTSDEGAAFTTAMDRCSAKASMEIQSEHPGNHVNWWTVSKTTKFLRDAGFQDVRVSAYGQSACPVLRNTHYFDSTRPTISLYVEARV